VAAFARPGHKAQVVDPAAAALTMTESLVQMKLPHSKRGLSAHEEKILGKQDTKWRF